METQSPIKIKVAMSFDEAIKEVINGKKVHKEEWDYDYWMELVDSRLKLHKPDGKFHDMILSVEDLEGEDYIVL